MFLGEILRIYPIEYRLGLNIIFTYYLSFIEIISLIINLLQYIKYLTVSEINCNYFLINCNQVLLNLEAERGKINI